MRPFFRRMAVGTLAALGALAAMAAASANDYPSRPVTLVVPYPPGGSTDLIGRMLAEAIQPHLGQSMVVENRGGATSAVGTQFVAQAPADGYTVLLAASAFTVNEAIRDDLQFKTSDFTPVSQLIFMPLTMVVEASYEAQTLEDFIRMAKEKPGSMSYGSAGIGSSNHLGPEMLAKAAGLDMVHVPYPGIGPAMTDLMGKRLQMLFGTIPAVKSAIDAGTVRPLAVTSTERAAVLPDVPTMDEAGVPGFGAADWIGIFVSAKTDPAIVARLEGAIRAAYADPAVRKKIEDLGSIPVASTSEEFKAFIADDIWGRTARELGVKAN
ncbi:MAG: tripartite tricarboxylate transporter substrate binding protein [Aquamicrobium sp.]|nr:tripartite tricarboxylate transporter substrate binding protein [Aquamicrobium sp.]